MAVRIDIKLPATCNECDFCKGVDIGEWKCKLTGITFPQIYGDKSRLKYCPLKEIKE